jgi:Tol biopolymer transport system component
MWRVVCAALCAAAIHAALERAAESANGQLAATLFDRLVTLNPDGTNQRTVWKVPGEGDSIANPVWSPDGNRIAFNYWDPVHDTRIAVYDLRTGAVRVVTDHPGPDADGNHTEDTPR